MFLCFSSMAAQGPKTAYYYNSQTELSFAECNIRYPNGNKKKIGFFPVINEHKFAPMGIDGYTKDIRLNDDIVFIADGEKHSGESDCYAKVNVANKVVMFYADFPGRIGKRQSLKERISHAITERAKRVVVVSFTNQTPLYNVKMRREIPVVSVNNSIARDIFREAGYDYNRMLNNWREGKIPPSEKLSLKLNLNLKGNYSRERSGNFEFAYHPDFISKETIKQIEKLNNGAIDFLLKLFAKGGLKWKKERVVYFDSFEAKIFYTGYWGVGFSSDEGVFNVLLKSNANYGLAVHENTHSLLRKNGKRFISFFDEGLARYAEAMATDRNVNNVKTIEYLISGKLFRLKEMLDFQIGKNSLETKVGYPAAGSFTEFLIDKYGLKRMFSLNGKSLKRAFGKGTDTLEREWLGWLNEKYPFEKKYIVAHLK